MSRRRLFTLNASTLKKSEAISRTRLAAQRRCPLALKSSYSGWGDST